LMLSGAVTNIPISANTTAADVATTNKVDAIATAGRGNFGIPRLLRLFK
jgi:hypothetical protein